MNKNVTKVIGGAIVGAVIGYGIGGGRVADLEGMVRRLKYWLAGLGHGARNSDRTVIKVKGVAGEDCKAKVERFRIGNKRNHKVYWRVEGGDAPCVNGNGRPEIELRFDNAPDGTVWNSGTIRVKLQGTTPWTIPDNANFGIFPYHVWMVGTRSYEMADPELEIER
jgi:hypothetical protein